MKLQDLKESKATTIKLHRHYMGKDLYNGPDEVQEDILATNEMIGECQSLVNSKAFKDLIKGIVDTNDDDQAEKIRVELNKALNKVEELQNELFEMIDKHE